ncbi:hypothetical protein F4778DRAFT_589833 [Xylariomycetidae sp. FL2044]|nr:hypothetical protein F4778DRAFT_589833 [Xylariomycetidae sp. FL2044]
MAEAENFEDDLFADLYDDNDTATASAPAPASLPTPTPAPVPAPVIPQPAPDVAPSAEPMQSYDEMLPSAEENVYAGDEFHDDNYDDDDDVDFNLGNGPSTAPASIPPQQDISEPTYHTPRGSNAKEDGLTIAQRREENSTTLQA